MNKISLSKLEKFLCDGVGFAARKLRRNAKEELDMKIRKTTRRKGLGVFSPVSLFDKGGALSLA